MKMKNVLGIAGLSVALILSSCGGGKSKEDEAARKKREADSLAAIEQARQDSIANALAVVLKDVVETAKADPNYSTFVELMTNAGLVEKLSDGNANFSLFIPTNDAFAKMDQKKLESLKTDLKKKQELTDLITYHVAAGKFTSTDLKSRPELGMLNEKVLTIKSDNDLLKVGGENTIAAEIECTNGVIYVIDAVLTPPAKKSKPKPPVTTNNTVKEEATPAVNTTKPGKEGVGGKQTGNETQQVGGKQTGNETQQVGGKSK